MLEHGRKAHNARPRAAEAVIDSVVIGRIRGADGLQRAILFGHLEPESHFAQLAGSGVLAAMDCQRPKLRLGVG